MTDDFVLGRLIPAPGRAVPSAKGLFRATGNVSTDTAEREADDFYPTPPEVTRAFLAVEGARLRDFTGVWEPAAGDGAMVRELAAFGLDVLATDLVDRGCGAGIVDFFDVEPVDDLPRAMVTNPPYKEVNAKHGQGRWLAHAFDLGLDYVALFLNWDWPAAAGLAALLARHPISRVYVARWKVDFTGKGSPPQRNAWFVWDAAHEGETVLRFLDRGDGRQSEMFAEARP